jgi:hypothetical protein
MTSLTGRVVLVTGGSSRSVARRRERSRDAAVTEAQCTGLGGTTAAVR